MKLTKTFLVICNVFLLTSLFLTSDFAKRFSPQAKVDWENMTGERQPFEKTACFDNQKFTFSMPEDKPELAAILGENTAEKRIEIDLTNQRIYAYEGGRQVYNFLISSGKWGRTPTGIFEIWTKLRYTKMSGGSKALHTYYYLPNVPYTMYFYNNEIPKSRGYGIHGTYWHSNFGHPMSHGCINMKTEEVALLYHWAQPSTNGKNSVYASAENPGTKVIIYGQAPAE